MENDPESHPQKRSRRDYRVLPAVTAATEGCEDRAAVQLAVAYARKIDAGDDLSKLGPALLSVLEALQLTPRARAAIVKGGTRAAVNPLDELKQRRARRDRAETVDPAAP